MINKHLPTFIDIAFCFLFFPLLLFLLPIERWWENDAMFLGALIGWLYTVYALHRWIIVPGLFKKKTVLWSLVLFLVILIITIFFVYDTAMYNTRSGRLPPEYAQRVLKRFNPMQHAIWFLYVVVIAFGIAVSLLSELVKQITEKQALEFEKKKAELALYKAQINPHFLFNTLNMLYGLIITDSNKLEKAFMVFIDLMKYMYSEATKDTILLEKEVEYIKQYIELHKYRINNKTNISFSVKEDKKQDVPLRIAPMMLITFVENALKYGTSSHAESSIDINVKIENRELCFNVCNTIVGSAEKKQTGGIGVENCRKRLKLLYPDNHSLEINDSGKQFNVKLMIKL